MNTRGIIVLALCASGVGFAAGYLWPRDPIEDPASRQLLSVTDKIASDVAGIQKALARDAVQCPSEQVVALCQRTAQGKGDVDANPRHEIEAERKTNRDDELATAQLQQQAEAIVMRGVSSGRWTENDVQELRLVTNGLSGAQKQAIVAPLLQAINAQQVKLEVEHGGVL